MMKTLLFTLALLWASTSVYSQACTPQGDETSYGTNNVWIGYVYDNMDFTGYKGFVTEGTGTSPDFDENFGGASVIYATNGCSLETETFSVRYKLSKNFTAGDYTFNVGADDGVRLSIDGGNTWVIDHWALQSYTLYTYTATLNGTVNLVLEYYENSVDNRVSFEIENAACGTENTTLYGTGDVWNGYIYDGTSFNLYKGMVHEGTAGNPGFTQNYGGSNNQYATSGCNVQTETFSARYRLQKIFPAGNYTFMVGGDDGYRLNLDGGNTWAVNNWGYHSYASTTLNIYLDGTYDMVLEYFEGGGDNVLTFALQYNIPLPVKMISFEGNNNNQHALLNWVVTADSDPDHFDIEKSTDGSRFTTTGTITPVTGVPVNNGVKFSFTDPEVLNAVTFYRLKMTDSHGMVTWSKTIRITGNTMAEPHIKVFPTIITDKGFSITADAEIPGMYIMLSDLSGRTVIQKATGNLQAGQTLNISLNGTAVSKGLYVLRVTGNGKLFSTQKLIIQ